MVTGRRMDLATPGNAWTATTSRAIPGSLEAGPGDPAEEQVWPSPGFSGRVGRYPPQAWEGVGSPSLLGDAGAPLVREIPVVVEASCDHIATVVLRTIWRYWPRVGKPNLCPSDCRGLPLQASWGEMAGGKYACQ